MRALLVGISLVALTMASGCTTTEVRAQANQDVAVHPCTKDPFLRSVGLFGGTQPEIFLAGADLRREPPPAANRLTRVLNVTEVGEFRDPDADPVIDKCRSWLRSIGEAEVELTILWHDRNCSDFPWDLDDPGDCGSRASFRFSLEDLGMEEILDPVDDLDAALRRLLVVDTYFTQQIQSAGRHPATGVPSPPTVNVHLVAHVIRVQQTPDS